MQKHLLVGSSLFVWPSANYLVYEAEQFSIHIFCKSMENETIYSISWSKYGELSHIYYTAFNLFKIFIRKKRLGSM